MHISAGHFNVDLMQKPSSIEQALTHSWADYTGVDLNDNPDLEINKDKYL
jgi:hypothetical protein